MALNCDQHQAPPAKKVKLAGMSMCKDSNSVAPASSDSAPRQRQNGGSAESNGVNGGDQNEGLDSNLYSRQIYAIGESAMFKLRKANVLISGLGGVGVEISKNLILGGIRNVTLHDTKTTTWHDLSSQYYLSEEDLGRNRAEACFQKLAELNDSVACDCVVKELTEEYVSKFDLVILTEASFSFQSRVNDWTRAHGRYFISADARGLFSYSFVDLGEQFRIEDQNGDACREVIIEYVDRETGNVMTLEGAFHGFEDGDYVTFSEIKGMTQLNNIEPMKITVVKPNIFNIGKVPADFGDYIEGCGRARQVKVPSFVDFKPLKRALEEPEFIMWDFANFEAPSQLHSLWQALYAFEEKHGRSPNVRSNEDAELLSKELPTSSPEIPKDWTQKFSFQATGNLQPITSLIGGIAAQEAMKAVTHHTTPQQQFLYTHHLDALPGDYSTFDTDKVTAKDCAPRNSRYDGQIAVFGWPFQKALFRQRWFIVGAGAIGCELLKNFAMIGVGCNENDAKNGNSESEKGGLKITDMDQIEISNLNRQFLFRRADVGGKKSEVAARAVQQFNPNLNIEALADRVAEDTEEIFSDLFFDGLSGVANALDNVDARRYMDRRCVYYQLPLLESGTMGPKGNTQVIYPHVTESYSSTNDPPEKETPSCTLKHFPYEIQHTIQWARSQFEDLFTNPAEKVNKYLADARGFLARLEQMHPGERIQDLRIVKQALIDERPTNANDCVLWARKLFDSYYHNAIAQLLHNFPAEQQTSSGSKFWSGTKRCPHTLTFDPNNQFHFDFVYAAAILHAEQYNLKPIVCRNQCAEISSTYVPEKFVPRANVRIAATEAEAANEQNEDDPSIDSDAVIDGLKLALARLQLSDTKPLQMIDFEKDDDSNHHVEFVTAASNLRAENYDIPQADAMKTKQIAGRIIPALATTTAVVAGLVSIELYKVIEANGEVSKAPLERFKNGFLNLAGPFYTFSEPGKAPVKKYGEKEFTLWDRLEIRGPMTMKGIIDWITDNTGLQVSMLSSGVSLLYAFFQPPAKIRERMEKDIIAVVTEVSRKPVPAHRKALVFEAMTTGDDDEDVEIPYIKYSM